MAAKKFKKSVETKTIATYETTCGGTTLVARVESGGDGGARLIRTRPGRNSDQLVMAVIRAVEAEGGRHSIKGDDYVAISPGKNKAKFVENVMRRLSSCSRSSTRRSGKI